MRSNCVTCTGEEIALQIGKYAYQALLEEAYTTPKPGLVDLYSSGAHQDMDIDTFERSAEALFPYFVYMAAKGYTLDYSYEQLFDEIRKIGRAAEEAMYRATDGINTHKGLIFTMGILCAAAGRCMRRNRILTLGNLIEIEQEMTRDTLKKEILSLTQKNAKSHGERIFQRYGVMGARGEAMRGYPSVTQIAYPVLQQGIREGRDWNQVKLQSLLVLMGYVEDSNILARGGMEELQRVQKEMRDFLKAGGAYAPRANEKLKEMDQSFLERNVSAGGCADLLAAAIFLTLILRGTENDDRG